MWREAGVGLCLYQLYAARHGKTGYASCVGVGTSLRDERGDREQRGGKKRREVVPRSRGYVAERQVARLISKERYWWLVLILILPCSFC